MRRSPRAPRAPCPEPTPAPAGHVLGSLARPLAEKHLSAARVLITQMSAKKMELGHGAELHWVQSEILDRSSDLADLVTEYAIPVCCVPLLDLVAIFSEDSPLLPVVLGDFYMMLREHAGEARKPFLELQYPRFARDLLKLALPAIAERRTAAGAGPRETLDPMKARAARPARPARRPPAAPPQRRSAAAAGAAPAGAQGACLEARGGRPLDHGERPGDHPAAGARRPAPPLGAGSRFVRAARGRPLRRESAPQGVPHRPAARGAHPFPDG